MLVVTLAALFGITAAAFVPEPTVNHLKAGGLELTVEDVPGLELNQLKYTLNGKTHYGQFFKTVEGLWKHQNTDVQYNDEKIQYNILGQLDGEPVFVHGTAGPVEVQETGLMPPQRLRRAGYTVMRDDFSGDLVDTSLWDYEVSMYGGYNWEVQVYTNDKLNAFTRGGNLYLKPTLTSEKFGEDYLLTGTMDMKQIWGACTNNDRYGCHREGRYGTLPPVMSAKLKSKKTITFGSACARAKIPRGDWLWPAIWMLPRDSHYGSWPKSGEIDLMESRGNEYARSGDGSDHGVNQIGSTLHWGPDGGQNKYYLTHGDRNDNSFANSFHTYCVDWTVDHLIIKVDDHEVMRTNINAGGFWQKGGFSGNNLWSSGSKAAPFDQPFYFIMNVAVAGTNGFFPDNWSYNSRKPWNNNSPTEPEDFWRGRNDWLPSWNGDDVAMQIDYVEMIQY